MRRNGLIRPLLLVLLLTFLTMLPLAAAARLPQSVIPDHYTLSIAPDLAAETFSGEETIDVDVKDAVDSITLNAATLELHDVIVTQGEKHLAATVTLDEPGETATLKLTEPLAIGRGTIHIAFSAKLGQQLRGLYLSRTAKRKYAVTQFEATSARRAFPCFDEPAMKATYDITLVIDAGDGAISNSTVISDTPAGAGKHAVRFGTTKKMSTYLVAMLVGDFQCIEGSADGIPIRVCATPGLQNLGHFALAAAEASVSYFDRYYDIKYPFGKLDLIGIPDFAAGAMENAGAITFRETDLLVDEKSASTIAQKRVAEVVAHEIAHQWFGDLVTMKWWNDLWLNEGFATFMSEKPVIAWKPEWHGELDRPNATDDALTIDSQLSTRPIRVPANSAEGSQMFDSGITYGKTASVLRMTEQWIGEDTFRDAIRVYLKKYSWSNAAAEDFWGTMKTSTKQPVDAVLQSFIDLTGAPLLHVTESCADDQRQVTIAQERMLPRGETPIAQTWTIPICGHVIGSAATEPCQLVTKASQTLTLPSSCTQPLFLSRIGSGYFLTDYAPAERMALREHIKEFVPAERVSYHGNEWLLVRNGRRDIGEYLGLVRAMPRPAERPLVSAITDNLTFINERLVNDQNRAAWQTFVHDALRGYAPTSWDAPAGETPEQRLARATILWTLGYAGGDQQVIAGARQVAAAYMKDPASVDALIADRALRLSAVYGDEAFFDRVLEQLASAPTPELAGRYRLLLPLFRDPKVVPRAIDFIYSARVRSQDLPSLAAAQFSNPVARPAAWAAAKSRWNDVDKQSPGAFGRVALATGSFCDAASRKDVEAFFADRPANGRRALPRALESIDTCIAFRASQQQSFDATLSGGTGKAGY